MANTPTYRVVLVPQLTENDSDINSFAQKYREFRLRALKEAPDAFASTYEDEIQRGLEQSVQRLTNPKAAHFIALRATEQHESTEGRDGDVQCLLHDQWVGAVVLLGPEEGDEFSVPSANIDPFKQMTGTAAMNSYRLFEKSEDPLDIHFHINGTFVDPSARGNKLGDRLMAAALKLAEEEAVKHDRKLRVTLSVFSHNPAARRLYEKAGFRVLRQSVARSKQGFIAIHMQLDKAGAP
jgi:ribosomal protein S18 acetylase RimI-like enzyme